jgi:CrcB protein
MIEKLSLLPYVFLGGGIGASTRWFVSIIFFEVGTPLWLGTLFVNAIGTLIFFLMVKFGLGEASTHHHLIKIGLLGSLTTFSTFSYEVFSAAKNGDYSLAAAIFSLNILAGVIIAIGMLR